MPHEPRRSERLLIAKSPTHTSFRSSCLSKTTHSYFILLAYFAQTFRSPRLYRPLRRRYWYIRHAKTEILLDFARDSIYYIYFTFYFNFMTQSSKCFIKAKHGTADSSEGLTAASSLRYPWFRPLTTARTLHKMRQKEEIRWRMNEPESWWDST